MYNLLMKTQDHKNRAAEIFQAGLEAVDPYRAVSLYTERLRAVYRDNNLKRLFVVGFGKAAYPMACAVEDAMGDLITAGSLITKYGHCKKSEKWKVGSGKSKIKVFEAGHPVPDANGVKGTEQIIQLLNDADENTLVVCLVSGGGSALLVAPYEGIRLDEKQLVTQLLLKAGANINELNTVRKHISKIKGGRLAQIAYPAKVISLMLSDVIGDRLDIIASGPTAPDPATYSDALSVLKKYRLADSTPRGVLNVLNSGVNGTIAETPKKGDAAFNSVENIVIGSNRIALHAAKQKAGALGFHAEIISYELSGDAADAAKWLADKAKGASKGQGARCLISGGETTVIVKGNGLGGRNMELALVFAQEVEEIDGITFLSAGTDGTDGPTDAAGAIVDGHTLTKAMAAGLDPLEYLTNNDSYNFFKKTEGLFITGPTSTNVMDLQIILLD